MYPVTHLVVNSQNPDRAPVLPPALGTRRRARRQLGGRREGGLRALRPRLQRA